MASSARPITYRMRTEPKFLVDPTAPQMRREREFEWVSRSYPPSPVMASPPSPILHPEHPPRSQTPDNWNLSSPNPSEMPSPMRRALGPMLLLAREAKEESRRDRDAERSSPSFREARAEDVPLSRRSASKSRSSPASPPQSRASQSSYRKYHSPRVESESDPEEGGMSRAWRTTPAEREPPRTPPLQTAPLVPRGAVTSPRRQKSKVKRASVAHRRIMDSAALSSDSGIAGSPLCQSPLVGLPLPDIPPSASEFERSFFPPERPTRSQQRTSLVSSPPHSALALQPGSPREGGSREVPRETSEEEHSEAFSQPAIEPARQEPAQPQFPEERYRPHTPSRSRTSDSFNGESIPVPLSPGSTLAQTRPASPTSDARSSSPKVPFKPQAQAGGKPVEEPAVRHSMFYMEDEMIIMRVENCLFRVHRYFLERDSTFFKDFFQRTLAPGSGAGKTDDTAVRLQEVSRREFECLLHFLYHGASNPQNDSILSLVLLLSTSTTLAFPSARAHAISALDGASPPLDPVERVFLAEKYGIPAWRRPAYVELCARSHPLEDAEAEVLGLQTTARLARAREAVLEEKVQEWRRAVERAQSGGEAVTKEDMEVREAKLVERVVDEIFASER
ncbi:hypothetical protein C8Q78DRAFT_730427 [Trametes maxima]|nr:hypothetical protein C8Q78DRAFT_730427 [Trametes maxima]